MLLSACLKRSWLHEFTPAVLTTYPMCCPCSFTKAGNVTDSLSWAYEGFPLHIRVARHKALPYMLEKLGVPQNLLLGSQEP